ncbi:MAG: hypothetical protein OHK0039_20550 [Bacteroidia bacterium]
MGVLTRAVGDTLHTELASTLPNLRLGYMIGDRWTVHLLLPGTPYRQGGQRRGFEGILLAGQYWPRDAWWVLAGAGAALDFPAFWTVEDPAAADFRTGMPAFTFATGYEVWRKNSFVLDLQYRLYAGQIGPAGGTPWQGLSNMIMLGINWY